MPPANPRQTAGLLAMRQLSGVAVPTGPGKLTRASRLYCVKFDKRVCHGAFFDQHDAHAAVSAVRAFPKGYDARLAPACWRAPAGKACPWVIGSGLMVAR